MSPLCLRPCKLLLCVGMFAELKEAVRPTPLSIVLLYVESVSDLGNNRVKLTVARSHNVKAGSGINNDG